MSDLTVNNVMSFVCQELPVPKSLSAPPPPDVHVLDPNAASFYDVSRISVFTLHSQ